MLTPSITRSMVYSPSHHESSLEHIRLTVHNPNDGSLVAHDVALAGADDVNAAVLAAEKAFPSWRALAPQARQNILLKFASLLEKHVDALGDLSRITLGQPKWITKYEICRGANTFKYYAGWIDKFAGESFPQEDGFMKIVRNEPLGVTVGILPWNGPISSLSLKAAAALATGNCHIIKPSEKTPFSTAALGLLIIEAGFPPGVFQILTGDGSTGALLAAHMRVRKVSFTGSIPTGKRVQEAAAQSNLKRVTLELGGKSPAVIFDDCNLQNAIEWTTRSITLNTGQACFAASRVYVHEDLAEKFIEAYKTKFKEITTTIGDPDDESTLIGPLVDETQFKRVSGYIERGQNGQGTMIIGGKRVGDKVNLILGSFVLRAH
jgi:aldehyde dehydrogenase (NAD+)